MNLLARYPHGSRHSVAVLVGLATLLARTAAPVEAAPQPASNELFRERLVARVPGGLAVKQAAGDIFFPVFNRDGTSVTYVAMRLDALVRTPGGGERRLECLVIDTRCGPDFIHVERPVFSPDGATVAYLADRYAHPEGEGVLPLRRPGLTGYVVVGGAWAQIQEPVPRPPPFDSDWEPVFSPDGRRLAFKRRMEGRESIAVAVVPDTAHAPSGIEQPLAELELEEGEWFDWVGGPVFSSDGRTLAYPARIGKEQFAVIDGRRGPSYDRVAALVFAPTGRQAAYAAVEDGQFFFVTGDAQGPRFDAVYEAHFSPDGTRLAYPAKRGDRFTVVVGDDQRTVDRFYDEVVFSADGAQVAYWAFDDDRRRIRVGKERGRRFDRVGWPVFSPDLSTWAYWARDGRFKYRIVLRDERGPKHDDVGRLPGYAARPLVVFGPDGREVAYGARDGEEFWWRVLRR